MWRGRGRGIHINHSHHFCPCYAAEGSRGGVSLRLRSHLKVQANTGACMAHPALDKAALGEVGIIYRGMESAALVSGKKNSRHLFPVVS